MRATRILLAALAVALVAACAGEPTAAVQSKERPSFDGAGVSGSGTVVQSDTTEISPERGSGFSGSGN